MDFSVLLLLMIAKEEELFFGAKQNHHHSWWICYTSIHQQKHSKVLGDKKKSLVKQKLRQTPFLIKSASHPDEKSIGMVIP